MALTIPNDLDFYLFTIDRTPLSTDSWTLYANPPPTPGQGYTAPALVTVAQWTVASQVATGPRQAWKFTGARDDTFYGWFALNRPAGTLYFAQRFRLPIKAEAGLQLSVTPHIAADGSDNLIWGTPADRFIASPTIIPARAQDVDVALTPGAFPKFPTKDPGAVLDYNLRFKPLLAPDETVIYALWTADAGIKIDADFVVGTDARAWLSGGTAGTSYDLHCAVLTNTGRLFPQSVTLPVAVR